MDTAKPGDVVRMERPPLPATFAGNQPLVSASELARMPIGLRIMFDPATREYFEDQARRMADPRNRMVPNHCHDDVQLCFSIITDALNWNMIPQKVAMATYNVHNKIGYEGKLIRAIMLNSGFVTEIKFEHGPNLEAWEKVEGRFKSVNTGRSDKNGNPVKKNVATYTEADEQGLWCRGTAVMADGTERHTGQILLRSCHPRNATTWATSPKKQIEEVVSRVLGNIAVPHAMMGARFDVGLEEPEQLNVVSPEEMTDITPESAEGLVYTGEYHGKDGEVEIVAPGETVAGSSETAAKPKPEPERQRKPRLYVMWGGEKLTRTDFTRLIKRLVKDADSIPALADLHTNFNGSLVNKSDAHDELRTELNPLFKHRSEQLQGPDPEDEVETNQEPPGDPLEGVDDTPLDDDDMQLVE